jgi:hypothetical protein
MTLLRGYNNTFFHILAYFFLAETILNREHPNIEIVAKSENDGICV